jgi:membrane protease YdiL (CAAX protease family)
MKTLRSYPAWLKVTIYFLVMWLGAFIAGIIPSVNGLVYFFAVALMVSWFLLRADHLNLSSLGCLPQNKRHWRQLCSGFISGCLMLVITAVITLALTRANWHFNKDIDALYILMTFVMCLCSAYIQEFVFRGYPFQVLLNKYRPWMAQLAIAIPFGLMHVNHSMSLQGTATVMLTTGLGTVLFGLAYIKTKNLMLPTGIHLGWNFAQALIPRTSSVDPKTLITVSGDQISYGSSSILLPYLVIVTVSIMVLIFVDFNQTTRSKAIHVTSAGNIS